MWYKAKMRLSFLLFLTSFLAGPQAGLAAESDPLHLTGSRVRLFVSDRSTAAGRLASRGQAQTGTVIEVRGDTLLFTADHQSTQTLIPATSLMGLEVSRGRRSHVLAGAGYGFLGGVLVGALVGAGSSHRDFGSGYGSAYFIASGALIGGGVGIVAVAIIGSRRTERWKAVWSLPEPGNRSNLR